MASELERRLAALLDQDAEAPADGEGWSALLAQVGRERRAEDEGGLAHGEFLDELHVGEDDASHAADTVPVRLAASEAAGPGVWRSGPWTLHVNPHPEGGWHVLLQGPGPASLGASRLAPGAWVQLPGDGLPDPLVLTLDDGTPLTLSR